MCGGKRKWRPDLRALGDAWERSYGDLGWRNLIPERVMPWYFATHDGVTCHGYGVKTDAAALCFWQLDPEGVSLWLNVTNGGDGVELGQRKLTMATVVTRRGVDGESAQDAVAGLCRSMCARASRPIVPIYGANDWDYSYGRSTAETILRDTEFIAELSPSGGARPFSVVDGGWTNGTAAWPDMGKLAHEIKQRTVRPGLWIRPLEAPHDAARGLLVAGRAVWGEGRSRARELAYDPTHPEAQEKIRAKMREATGWGYEMVKHDFSTYDLLGQWGFEMGPQPTLPGWSLHDRSRTNAEVIAGLYALLRDTAGRADTARWLQYRRPPGPGHLRPAAHGRRHQRPPVGADPAHGGEHARLSAASARNFLHSGRGSGGHYGGGPMGVEPAVARSAGAERNGYDRLCGAASAGSRSNAQRCERPSRSWPPAALTRGHSIGWRPAPLSVGRQVGKQAHRSSGVIAGAGRKAHPHF